jgi:hypothetical protein
MNRKRMFAAFSIFLLLAACTTYYEVKDPTSDKVYYTTKVDRNRDGSVQLTNDVNGASITLQNSEIKEVDKETYKTNMPKD